MSRDELIVLVRRQDVQISAQAGKIVELVEANEALAGRLARVEHLLSRNNCVVDHGLDAERLAAFEVGLHPGVPEVGVEGDLIAAA